MTPEELRAKFLAFCGPSRFRKFASSLYRQSDNSSQFKRLLFWQERLWERFALACPTAPTDVQEIGSCLEWCDLHETPLVAGPGHQPIDLRYSKLCEVAKESKFPHGYGWLGHHCPACRDACIAWINANPSECRMPLHVIHDADWVALHRMDHAFKEYCKQNYMPWDDICPGDEVWMIDTGEGPTHPALVRDGRIVPIMD
jgi:hypothetical protein